MVDNIKENGLIITWTEWVFIRGLMEDATWVNTKTTRNMGTESTNGLMDVYTSDNGCVENNTGLVSIRQQILSLNTVYGKKVNVSSGSKAKQ